MRLAARLADKAGLFHPMDWWKVYGSHTPHEWALQKARAAVDPWGEDRADFRAALNTLQVVCGLALKTPDQDNLSSVLTYLRTYTQANRIEEKVVGPAAIRQAMGE
jgi:hypothetical protein